MSAAGDKRQLLILASGVVFFFTVHNWLQEAIVNRPGFTFGWFLGLLEMLGTCFFSFLERTFKQPSSAVIKSSGGSGVYSRANLIDYGVVVFCLMASSSLSNIALNYINFPTKVVFRSCKLLPTMLIATLLHSKAFRSAEWAAAAAVCVGLVLVAAADFRAEGPAFSPLGISLVCLSVVADAVMPNVQQRLFARGESRTEVVFWTNLAVSAWMLVSLGASGDLQGALGVARHDQTATAMMLAYAVIAYVAVSFHMTVVQRFGGVTGVLVGNGRKVITIAVSFVAFPKPLSLAYVLGVAFSLGGLTAAVLLQEGSPKGVPAPKGSPKRSRSDSKLEGAELEASSASPMRI